MTDPLAQIPLAPPPSTLGGILARYPQARWVLSLTLLLAMGHILPPVNFFSTPVHYLPLHTVLEVLSIVVSGMVFGLAWSLRRLDDSSRRMVIGAGFLAVCLIDIAHTLSYDGMPDFFTASGPEKAINFWLAARYVSALTLLAVAFLPLRRWSEATCYLVTGAAIVLALLVLWLEIAHSAWLPHTFIPGQGLTPFKVGAEYLVAALYALAALRLTLHGWRTRAGDWLWLAAAAWIQGLAEMFFTLYASVSDIYNLLGHVYKAISYLMIYYAVFVRGVLAPYRELEYERSWLRTLLATIPDPVWLKNADGVYLSCNDAFARMFGKSRADIIGQTDEVIFDAATAEEFRRNDQAVLRSKQQKVVEEAIQDASGRTLIFESTKTPMPLPSGETIGVLGIAHDITEKAATEENLRVAATTFESQEGIFITDADGVILRANHAFTRITGYSSGEVEGRKPSLLRSDRHDADFFARLWQTIADTGSWHGEVWNRHKQGSDYLVLMTLTSVKGESGQITHYVANLIDITARKRDEEELATYREHLEDLVASRTQALATALQQAEAANRAKSVFLSNMSHELRTPLNAVIGFSRLMAKSKNLDEGEKKNLDIINRSGNHLLTLINDVLELSKIEAGHVSLQEDATDISALASDVVDMLRPRAEQAGLRLLSEIGQLPAAVRVDTVKLRQILINLLGNAIKFTRQGQVTLRLNASQDGMDAARIRLQVAVRDTGIGIAPADQAAIFEPFVQLVTHATSAGTGLGLTITRQYLKMMGSKLDLESTPSQGSEFRFSLMLPIVARQSPVADSRAQGRVLGLVPAHLGIRLLVVEDNPDSRHLLHQLLAPLGFDIAEAADGVEAVRLAESWQPRLIIMDWRMPNMDGLDATRHIRALPLPQAPKILLLTASAFEEQRQTALAAGIDDFLRKPFEEDDLFAALEKHLDLCFLRVRDPGPVAPHDAPAAGDAAESEPTAADLELLPAPLREALRLAVEELNPAKIGQALQQLATTSPRLAGQLEKMAARFQYREMWALLTPPQPDQGGKAI